MSAYITKILREFNVSPLIASENGMTIAEIAMAEEIARLRARVEVLEQLTRESLDILTCAGHDTGHYCVQCGIIDYKWPHRSALSAALETKP